MEWGASAAMTIAPDEVGRGFALRIAPSWGAASSEVQRLWSGDDTARFGESRQHDNAGALRSDLSYGVRSPLGEGVVASYAGLELTGEGDRRWRLGGRWTVASAFRLTLEGGREEFDDLSGPDNAITLRSSIQW